MPVLEPVSILYIVNKLRFMRNGINLGIYNKRKLIEIISFKNRENHLDKG